MKKKTFALFITIIAVVFAVIPTLVSCNSNRSEVLKVYNWQDYIGEGVLDGFVDYYKSVTGKDIKVKYTTFDTNELMMSKIISRADYDVICPSDYAIEKMRVHDLLLPLDKNLGIDVNGNDIEDYRNMMSDLVMSRPYDPDNEYSRAYTWGTMGILYNYNKIIENPSLSAADRADADGDGHPDYFNRMGWSALWDANFKDQIYMKDSLRDSFAIGALYTFKEQLLAGTKTAEEVLNTSDPDEINLIEKNLKKQFPILKGYEVDTGKQEAADGHISMTLQWGGDAVWAIADAAETTGADLRYFIPYEGSNIFFDGWCIPKYAGNVSAAQLFINYMCRPDVSIANMDYIGYSSPCNTEEFIEYMNESFPDETARPLEYFMGEGNLTPIKAPESMYPDWSVLERCGVMRDFGKAELLITQMWINVKSN